MKNLILSLFLIFQPMLANAAWEVTAPYTASYSASTDAFTPYATPQDLCVLGNPGNSVTFRVFHVRVWGTQTTGGINNFFIIKRRAFDTFAANSDLTVINHDSFSIASSADVTVLTAAPITTGQKWGPYNGTGGTGIVRASDVFIAAPGGLANSYFDFDFGPNSGTQPVILHANEMLALNMNGIAVPSGQAISCEFNWTEQSGN
jgi:hypothetical protein